MKRSCVYITAILIAICFGSCKTNIENVPVLLSSYISFNQNPSGNWQVGYSLTASLSSGQFQLSTKADTGTGISFWHPSAAQYYPYLGQNHSTTLKTDATNSWAVQPGEFAMEASNSGQYSMLRFIAPAAGSYRLKATFRGVHSGLSTTDVHILLNSLPLFNDLIDGYGGDSTFHAIQGAHPSASYNNTLTLQTNDTLTFAVGYGSNGTHYNDTNGLLISIEKL